MYKFYICIVFHMSCVRILPINVLAFSVCVCFLEFFAAPKSF